MPASPFSLLQTLWLFSQPEWRVSAGQTPRDLGLGRGTAPGAAIGLLEAEVSLGHGEGREREGVGLDLARRERDGGQK